MTLPNLKKRQVSLSVLVIGIWNTDPSVVLFPQASFHVEEFNVQMNNIARIFSGCEYNFTFHFQALRRPPGCCSVLSSACPPTWESLNCCLTREWTAYHSCLCALDCGSNLLLRMQVMEGGDVKSWIVGFPQDFCYIISEQQAWSHSGLNTKFIFRHL